MSREGYKALKRLRDAAEKKGSLGERLEMMKEAYSLQARTVNAGEDS